jgi:hypothetical protein
MLSLKERCIGSLGRHLAVNVKEHLLKLELELNN